MRSPSQTTTKSTLSLRSLEPMMTLTEIELEHIDDVWYQDEMDAEEYAMFLGGVDETN